MRVAINLLLGAFCLPAAAAALPPCVQPVRFSAAWFADPEVDNSKSTSELKALAAAVAVAGKGTQLGHVMVQTKLVVVPQESCAGVTVQLDYLRPALRVASEIPPGSCAYASVMNHEQTHVRIHRDIARQFRALDFPWPQGASSAAILAFAKQELDRLMQAQRLFDSPEEYARNQTVCGGEIGRLVKPKASAGPTREPA